MRSITTYSTAVHRPIYLAVTTTALVRSPTFGTGHEGRRGGKHGNGGEPRAVRVPGSMHGEGRRKIRRGKEDAGGRRSRHDKQQT